MLDSVLILGCDIIITTALCGAHMSLLFFFKIIMQFCSSIFGPFESKKNPEKFMLADMYSENVLTKGQVISRPERPCKNVQWRPEAFRQTVGHLPGQ